MTVVSVTVVSGRTIDEAWEGVMVTYIEQDFPSSPPYERTVPGWKCKSCGQLFGTSGLPPERCACGASWAKHSEQTP